MMVKALVNWKDSSDERFDWHRPSVFLSDHDTAWRVTGTRVMTHDTWQSPSPGHYAPHLPSSPADDPRIVDPRLARISSLLSGARVSGVGWWARAAICVTWAIVTGLCLGIMSSARTKNPSWGARESRDPRGDGGVTESTGLSVTVITQTQCGHRDEEHLPESFYHFNLCSFGTKSSEHCERNNCVTFSSAQSHK